MNYRVLAVHEAETKSSEQRKIKALGVSLKGNQIEKSCANRRKKAAGEIKSSLPKNGTIEKPSKMRQSAGGNLWHEGKSCINTTGEKDLGISNGDDATPPKITLQLFPVNSATRLKLEKDGHNPFLELTLSVRKKISSIIKHLNSKWGCFDRVLDELMLFPYDVRLERISSFSRWTLNSGGITAGEVHSALGRPTIFRLRYGWLSNLNVEASGISFASVAEECLESRIETNCNDVLNLTCEVVADKGSVASFENRNPINIDQTDYVTRREQMPQPLSVADVNSSLVSPWDDSLTSLSIGGLLSEVSLMNKIKNSTQKTESKSSFQPIELVSDISVGALLSEASLLNKLKNPEDRSENISLPDILPGGILCNASLQSKTDNYDLKTPNQAGCQLIHLDSELSLGGMIEVSSQRDTNGTDRVPHKMASGLKSGVEKREIPSQSFFPWDDDNFISLSIGGFLSEPSSQGKFDGCDSKSKQSASILLSRLPILGSSKANDSAQHTTPLLKQASQESFSSILDAEETCNAFSFKTISSLNKVSVASNLEDTYGGHCDDPKN